eukprot:14148138-Alexandrium_andersonii.AAC.1
MLGWGAPHCARADPLNGYRGDHRAAGQRGGQWPFEDAGLPPPRWISQLVARSLTGRCYRPRLRAASPGGLPLSGPPDSCLQRAGGGSRG